MLRQLCHRVELESSPHIQNSLETFLQQLVTDLKWCHMEHRSLEEALKLKDDKHEAQVIKLHLVFTRTVL
jgi:electron transfer flavoprotein alpha/beta subunit